jgi:regulatory protein
MKARASGKRAPRPLDRNRLEELALAYVARFATSRAKLEDYLRRKLRERGWDGDGDPQVADVARRMEASGYVDDRAYAAAKSGSLLRRGYGERRVGQALSAAGIAADVRDDVRATKRQQRRAALALARKRGFGPFGREMPDRAQREKQIAAMLRAGHALDSARELTDAASIAVAEEWAAGDDGEEEDGCD